MPPSNPLRRRRLILSGLLIAALALSPLNFPCLLYPVLPGLNPYRDSIIQLEGRTIFISDLHLDEDTDPSIFSPLRSFIVSENVANIVIVGDLFQYPNAYNAHREESAFRTALNLLNLSQLQLNVYFVIGSPTHDPQNVSYSFTYGRVRFETVGRLGRFKIGELELIAYHGDDACKLGPLAFLLSYSTRSLMLERAWKKLAGVKGDVWVIMGHTHVPGIDFDSKVANCGGWVKKPPFNPPVGEVVAVEEGEVKLVPLLS